MTPQANMDPVAVNTLRNLSAEGKLLAFFASVFPKESTPAQIVQDLLADAEPREAGEERWVADGHSVIFIMLGGLLAMAGICLAWALEAALGVGAHDVLGAIFLAPGVFLVALANAIQVAKLRGRHRGIQPLLGLGSWLFCAVAVLVTATYLLS